ncbi:MAG: hypothetical protein ACREMQ_11710 [Longimicrobiales bacterium]
MLRRNAASAPERKRRMATLMARVRRAARLALALLLFPQVPLRAQTTQDPGLQRAIAAYQAGELVAALSMLDGVPPFLTAHDEAVRFLYRGLIQFAFGDAAQARAAFVRAVQAEPTVRLDPAVHAPGRVRAYHAVLDSIVSGWRTVALSADASGNVEESKRQWARVAEAMPSDTVAARRLEALLGPQPPVNVPPPANAPTVRDSATLPNPVPPSADSASAPVNVRRVEPGQAVMLGLLLPGMGEIYAGQTVRGILVLGAAASAVALGVLNERVTVECLTVPVDNFCPPADVVTRSAERPYLVPAIGAAFGIAVLGAIDAYLAARRANARADASQSESRAGRTGMRLEMPAVQPTRHDVRIEIVRVRF